MSERTHPDISRTQAAVRRSWWPGWIWAVPIAALLLVGWWAARTFLAGGEDITISFDDAHQVKQDTTSVLYRGMNVGQVTGIKLAPDGKTVDVTAHIDTSATDFLKSGTEFWLRGANPSLSDPSSFGAILSGPTIVMAPGPGDKATHFSGLTRRPVVSGAHDKPQIYEVQLSGAVGGLTPGEPVKLLGFTVGEVREVGFHYDAKTGGLETPVTLALYPSLFHLESAAGANATAALGDTIGRLVEKGLQARLERDPPLVGTEQVSLAMGEGKGSAITADANGIPQIPAAPSGGIGSIVDRVNKLPLDQIAHNMLDTTHHIDTLVSSPKLEDSVAHLDSTLTQIDETSHSAGPKLSELIDKLRTTATQLDGVAREAENSMKTVQQTAKAADNVMGGTPGQNDMRTVMVEITNAARSVRELANYLDQHPEALIKGRSGE